MKDMEVVSAENMVEQKCLCMVKAEIKGFQWENASLKELYKKNYEAAKNAFEKSKQKFNVKFGLVDI